MQDFLAFVNSMCLYLQLIVHQIANKNNIFYSLSLSLSILRSLSLLPSLLPQPFSLSESISSLSLSPL